MFEIKVNRVSKLVSLFTLDVHMMVIDTNQTLDGLFKVTTNKKLPYFVEVAFNF